MENICGSTLDIISHLPDMIIDKILMGLPIQEAARTSILSRKWRYIWMKLPQIVFDDMSLTESIRAKKDKLMMTIYQVLLLHRGPILKFTLSLSGLEGCSEIDQLILFLSNIGVDAFTLSICKGEPYKLPSSLYSCLQLKYLNLRSCICKPPPGFMGFSRLVALWLFEVSIADETVSSLISSCPLLEKLGLSKPTNSRTNSGYLEITAPNLKYLWCKFHCSSICFKNTPLLSRLSVYLNMSELLESPAFNPVMVFDTLPVIESLELDYRYACAMVDGNVRDRLQTALSHLKILKLYAVSFDMLKDVSTVLVLIRSSPKMEKLKIEAFTGNTTAVDSVLELSVMQGWSDVSLNKLREVEMQNVCGTRSELDFIKLLLAKSPMLETMLVNPNRVMVADKGLRILKELTRFPRSSPHAEITYKSPDGEV